MITTYGTINNEGTHTDTSKTLLGAKVYATLNGYNVVSKRNGYIAFVVAEKIGGKWQTVKH